MGALWRARDLPAALGAGRFAGCEAEGVAGFGPRGRGQKTNFAQRSKTSAAGSDADPESTPQARRQEQPGRIHPFA
jgi:hypothetical protein